MSHIYRIAFLVVLFLGSTASISAQGRITVSGTLLDEQSRASLSGVTVLELGSDQLTYSSNRGSFELKVAANAIISFSIVGYKLRDVPAAELTEGGEVLLTPQVVTSAPAVVWAPRLTYRDQYSSTAQRLGTTALRAGDAINISEAFDGLPGVQIQQGALNTQRLSLRGVGARTPFATNEVRLYWNDIPLTNGAGESVLEDIESGFLRTAYVQTGPAPAALGANLGGSIQLVSREWQSKNWSTGFGGSVGSFGRNRQWFNLHNNSKAEQNGSNWEQDISLVRSHSNGYRANNNYDRISGTVLGRFKHARAKTFYLVHLRQMDAEIPSSLNADDLVEKPEAAAFTWGAVNGREDQLTYLTGLQHFRELGFVGNGGNKLSNRTAIFVGRRTNDEVRPFNIINEDSYQYGLRSKFALQSLADFPRSDFELGGELFWEDYQQNLFETLDGGAQGNAIGDRTEQHFYAFAFAGWKARWSDKFHTEASLNVRAAKYTLETVISSEFDFAPFYLPSFSLYFDASQQVQFHARVNRGISQTDPSTSVENSLTNAEPLLPSYGWNQELGMQWRSGGSSGRLTAFRMNIEDALVTRMDEFGANFFFNGGSATHQGIEAQIGQAWTTGPNSQIALVSNYTLAAYNFKDFVDGSNDFSGNNIPGVPKHRWLSRMNWKQQQFQLGLTLDVASEQFVNDANTTTADGYALLHLRLAYDFVKRGKALQIYAGANNILDKAYVSMVQINARGFGGALPRSFYPGRPRAFYVGVNYGLDQK